MLQGVKLRAIFVALSFIDSRRWPWRSLFRPAGERRLSFGSPMRARVVLLFVCALACMSGCHTRTPLELLVVHRIEPERASAGDRVVVTGEGFPEGRSATVTFRGDLLRAGLPRQSDVRIVASAVPAERGAVAVAFDRAMERRFVGASAVHTTFVGDVQVAFQPTQDGSLSLYGEAHGVRFDVVPSAVEAVEASPDGTEHPALGFLGLAASPDPSGRGLSVDAVDPDGRAFAAGMRRGDRIVEVDGLSVLSDADLTVRGGQHVAHVVVERSGRPLPPLAVDVEGLSPLGVSDALGAASLVLLCCILLAIPSTRLGLLLRWLGRLVESHRFAPSSAVDGSSSLGALLLPDGSGRDLVVSALVPLVTVLAAFGWLATGRTLLGPDSDLLAMAIGTTLAVVVARALGGAACSRARALRAFLGGAARALVAVLPALGAVLGAVVGSGRFVIAEMVADQGGAPWRWAAMRNPGLFVLWGLLIASAAPDPTASSGESCIEGLEVPSARLGSTSRAISRIVEFTYLWTVCGLSVALFLGGWRVPGVASAAQEGNRALCALGTGLFLVKLWAIALGLGAIRRRTGRLAMEHLAPLMLRLALPATFFGLVLAIAWTAELDGLRSTMGADFAGYVAVMLMAALFAYIASAARRGRRRNVMQTASVNPWL